MKKMITLTIDDVEVKVEESSTVLDAAKSVGIYIPALCAHPNLPSAIGRKPGNAIYRGTELVRNSFPKEFEGCKLCVVEIKGAQTTSLACNTFVTEGMVVHTNTPRLKELRRDNLAQILANHPHACLTCAEREGCSREPCSLNVPVNERCCPKLGRCELQKVAEYIGIKPELTRYQSRGLPSLKDEPLFERDYNLCIGCLRCVRVCKDIRGVGALDFVWNGSEFVVGTISSASLKDSDCKFCGACVEVCPTGALTDKKIMMLAEREKELVPCSNACPAGIDVPRYVRLIKKEKFAEAYNVIREKVPFPSVLGRVCHRPCESECRRSELNEPIAVRELKRFVTEQAEGAKVIKKRAPTGKKVAVVGSGPAGLTASYYLAEKGYDVTVFESLPVAGGALAVCIPEYRLPKEILDIDIQNIRNAGVKIKTNVTVGNDVLFDDILKEYKAVFIATGAHKSLKLDIPNENADGVLYAMEFLKDANLKKKIKIGKRVGVIGGGNAAVDAARVANRIKDCETVSIIYRRTRAEMPAFKEEVDAAVEEGINVQFLTAPTKVLTKNGKVTGIECIKMRLGEMDETGRKRPIPIKGSEFTIELDTIIVAIGEQPDISFLSSNSRLEISTHNTLVVNPETLTTNIEGVFVAGDVVKGPASVVEAIAMGKKAASSIDRYLGGDGVIDIALVEKEKPEHWLGKEKGFADLRRGQTPKIPVEQRRSFAEVELCFDKELAVKEASRCLQCDLRLQISKPMFPPEKWLEFRSEFVSAVPELEGVYQLLNEKKFIIYIKGTANLRKELEEQLKTNDKARYFSYEEEPMYTKRETELLQQFLQQHGKLPEGNEELEELF